MKLIDHSCFYCGTVITLAYEPKKRVVCTDCMDVHDKVVTMVHQAAIAKANLARKGVPDMWHQFEALAECADMLRGVK